MGKYEPLAQFLAARNEDSWTATFGEIESKLGFELPPSAHQYRAWWSNQQGPGHSQKEGWQAAGWETGEVDLVRRLVRFERRRPRQAGPTGPGQRPADALWDKARAVTGIEDRDELIERALVALIQREAAQDLIRMGGSDPAAAAAGRERPWA